MTADAIADALAVPSPPPVDRFASSVAPSRAWGAVPVWLIGSGCSGNAVRLFALIAAKYAPRPGFSAPSPTLEDLGAELGVTERAVRKWRDELVAVGALHVDRHGPRASSYLVAGIGSDGPLGSEQPFTDTPRKTGTNVPESPEQPFRPTSSIENSKKTARSLNDGSPTPTRTHAGRPAEEVALHFATDSEKARVLAELTETRDRLGMPNRARK